MTALFLEYQAQKDVKDNAQSMIGKLFYWYKHLDGKEIPFNKPNLMRVCNIYKMSDTWYPKGSMAVEYNYVDTGLPGHQELTYFLKYAKPYIEDSL